jgi:putative heme-binding domain-containing protein
MLKVTGPTDSAKVVISTAGEKPKIELVDIMKKYSEWLFDACQFESLMFHLFKVQSPLVVLGMALVLPAAGGEMPAAGLADLLAREEPASLAAAVVREGDPLRGSNIFHTRQLACTQCHVVGEVASPSVLGLGPNLAAMPEGVSRDRLVAHLVESVLDPSAVVRPSYRGLTILTDEGKSITGLVASETADEIVLRDASLGGREISIPTLAIDERVPAAVSLMPAGLANLLTERQQFLDLVAYLAEVATGGPPRALELAPDPLLLAAQAPAAYESEIDHAALIAEWKDDGLSREALERGEKIFSRVCANCHGTLEAPGSLPTAPRFAEGAFKAGSDPYSIYRTLTYGSGMMVAQGWMVPSQKYDVIHYLRETFLKDRNPKWYTAPTDDYLASLPSGTSRGPEPSLIEPWRLHDYGPFLAGTFEVGEGEGNLARKGLAIRLDDGPGGVGRGHAWALYELDTLRIAAFWTGEQFIDWAGINFDGRHGAHPRLAGSIQLSVPTLPGWAAPQTGSFADPRPLGRDQQPYGPLPREHVRFKALHHVGLGGTQAEPRSGVVLDFQVGDTPVLEMPSLGMPLEQEGQQVAVLVRSFSLGLRPQELSVRLAAEPAAAAIIGSAAGETSHGPRIISRDGYIDLLIPAGNDPIDFAVAVAAANREVIAKHAAELAMPEPPRLLVGRPAAPLWATAIETHIGQGRADGPFAVDVLSAPEANPWNAQVRFSGLDFTAPDEAVICGWDGDVWRVKGISSPGGRLTWRRIASGLFQPLGIKVIGGTIYVGCRDRIVTLVDLDGDGMTDRYDTFNDDHQVTEHFHEFAMGLETDTEGNLYYAKSARHALPAVVPHHGTLLKVSRDGASTEIVANGFRAANGVCVEDDGTFWVTDQEGHWNPKNRINHVHPGGFYGNMFGYHDVTDASDAAMDPPAFWITNAFDRSPAELVRVASKTWTPLDGDLLELSYGEGRVHLVLTEPASGPVAGRGASQGGMVALPIPDLPTGIMRGRFSPTDGQLYACGLYAWAGNRQHPGGFFRIRRTEKPLTIPIGLHAERGSIALSFAVPLGAAVEATANWKVRAWDLERTQNYGSKHLNERPLPVAKATLSSDGQQVTLDVPNLAPTWCYSLEWAIEAADGSPVKGLLHGTMQ